MRNFFTKRRADPALARPGRLCCESHFSLDLISSHLFSPLSPSLAVNETSPTLNVNEASPAVSKTPPLSRRVTPIMLRSLLAVPVLVSSVYALVFNTLVFNPRATSQPEHGNLLLPPDPTPAAVALPELLRRDTVVTAYVAPDNTCGYISGLAGKLPRDRPRILLTYWARSRIFLQSGDRSMRFSHRRHRLWRIGVLRIAGMCCENHMRRLRSVLYP